MAWQKGQSGNPRGKPSGRRDFNTIFRQALEKIAASENVDDVDKVYVDLVVEGIKRAKKGDYRFYQDTIDRVSGPVRKDDPQIHNTTNVLVLPEERRAAIYKIASIHNDQERSDRSLAERNEGGAD